MHSSFACSSLSSCWNNTFHWGNHKLTFATVSFHFVFWIVCCWHSFAEQFIFSRFQLAQHFSLRCYLRKGKETKVVKILFFPHSVDICVWWHLMTYLKCCRSTNLLRYNLCIFDTSIDICLWAVFFSTLLKIISILCCCCYDQTIIKHFFNTGKCFRLSSSYLKENNLTKAIHSSFQDRITDQTLILPFILKP